MSKVSTLSSGRCLKYSLGERMARCFATMLILLGTSPVPLAALPSGAHGVQGATVHAPNGSTLTVDQQLQRAIVNWQDFSIGAGELVRFNQPGVDASILNRVTGGNLSEIYGTLSANGQVMLINPNGVLVGASGIIDTHSFIASTLNINDSVFLNGGDLHFFNPDGDGVVKGTITNLGKISAQGGDLILIASRVENKGTLSAAQGTVGIAAGYDEVLLADSGNRRLLVKLDSGDWGNPEGNDGILPVNSAAADSSILNEGQISAVRAELAAQAGNPLALAIHNEGAIAATGTKTINGEVWLVAPNSEIKNTGSVTATSAITAHADTFTNGGNLSADSATQGGSIAVTSRWLAAGDLSANGGTQGGSIKLDAGQLILGGTISATGGTQGGAIAMTSKTRSLEVDSSLIDVSGGAQGGSIAHFSEGTLFSSGTYHANGANGIGGRIDLTGESVSLLSAKLSATGTTQGGLVRIGGAFQGGKAQTEDNARTQSFVTRWGALPALASADTTFISDGSQINVSSAQGDGGTVVIWSDTQTRFAGGINATSANTGGTVEISAKNELQHIALKDVLIGKGGELLLDPKNITVVASAGGWTQQAVLGKGYTGGKNVDVTTLEANDLFGGAVALDADGDRLAVGARADDGSGNAATNSGAVYLFSFSDTSFSGGSLTATLGKGYTGGKNVDVTPLAALDNFGTSVSLDADGDRLAVGANNDDGSGNAANGSGAVYLFSFSDTSFSGGSLTATLGKGYTGGKNVDVTALDNSDNFGQSVSLDADGDRLAVGATSDDGSGNAAADSGAAYLFSFSDTSFSGGSLTATLGKGYTGGKNVDVTALENSDNFGSSVSLDADGDRLAVGASVDDGSGNAVANSGAVHLFSFTDTSFSGGSLQATLGKGYAGGKNFDVTALESGDQFGISVALDADGDRLAVGAFLDDGLGNAGGNTGAAYLFSFSDTSFSGGSLTATLGKGYTGGSNLDMAALEANDYFGSSVSLNATGDRLAVGANQDDGSGNAGDNTGAVYLFSLASTPTVAANDAFAENSTLSQNLQASDIKTLLDAGTAVTLQASNDITINSAITANNGAGNGGVFTLQAGRSIAINESITTDNGNFVAKANETAANGVVDAQRDAGAATITLATGKTINAGTGNITLQILDGTGVTNAAKGAITLTGALTGADITLNSGNALSLGNVTASGNLSATASGAITDSGAVAITGTTTLAAGATNDITLDTATNNFTGAVSITSGKDVTLVDTNALDLGASTVSGNLALTAGGTLSSSGTITVGGSTNPASTLFTLNHGGTGALTIKDGNIVAVTTTTTTTANTTTNTSNTTATTTTSSQTTNVTFGGAPVAIVNNTTPTAVRNFVGQTSERQIRQPSPQAVFQPQVQVTPPAPLGNLVVSQEIGNLEVTPEIMGINPQEFGGSLQFEAPSGSLQLDTGAQGTGNLQIQPNTPANPTPQGQGTAEESETEQP